MPIPIEDIPYQIFTTRKQWRLWLKKHHADKGELWLGFYKRGSNKDSIKNSEAVEEALCFGWINGKVRKLDDELYLQRFSPRHARSVWAPSNKQRVSKLLKAGLMTEAGMKLVNQAKENGSWDSVDAASRSASLAGDIKEALKKSKSAWQFFQQLTANQRRDYLWWVNDAKREETRKRRIGELVERCSKGLRPGM